MTLCEEVVWFSMVVNMSGLVAINLVIILLYSNHAYLVIDRLDLEIIKSFIFYLLGLGNDVTGIKGFLFSGLATTKRVRR